MTEVEGETEGRMVYMHVHNYKGWVEDAIWSHNRNRYQRSVL